MAGQWAEVNRLQAEIARAEKEFEALCVDCKQIKAKTLAKRQELTNLYDQQDRAVRDTLGPRELLDIEKKLEAGK